MGWLTTTSVLLRERDKRTFQSQSRTEPKDVADGLGRRNWKKKALLILISLVVVVVVVVVVVPL